MPFAQQRSELQQLLLRIRLRDRSPIAQSRNLDFSRDDQPYGSTQGERHGTRDWQPKRTGTGNSQTQRTGTGNSQPNRTGTRKSQPDRTGSRKSQPNRTSTRRWRRV